MLLRRRRRWRRAELAAAKAKFARSGIQPSARGRLHDVVDYNTIWWCRARHMVLRLHGWSRRIAGAHAKARYRAYNAARRVDASHVSAKCQRNKSIADTDLRILWHSKYGPVEGRRSRHEASNLSESTGSRQDVSVRGGGGWMLNRCKARLDSLF